MQRICAFFRAAFYGCAKADKANIKGNSAVSILYGKQRPPWLIFLIDCDTVNNKELRDNKINALSEDQFCLDSAFKRETGMTPVPPCPQMSSAGERKFIRIRECVTLSRKMEGDSGTMARFALDDKLRSIL